MYPAHKMSAPAKRQRTNSNGDSASTTQTHDWAVSLPPPLPMYNNSASAHNARLLPMPANMIDYRQFTALIPQPVPHFIGQPEAFVPRYAHPLPAQSFYPDAPSLTGGMFARPVNEAATRVPSVAENLSPELLAFIEEMDTKTLRLLVQRAARDHPDVQETLQGLHYEEVQRRRSRVVNFDHHSKTVWYVLNKKYDSLSGSKQYNISGDVHGEIMASINKIADNVYAESSFGTKRSAVETLRKIGKSICLSGDTLGHEVKQQFEWTGAYVPGILKCLGAMTAEERARLCGVNTELVPKFEELIEYCNDNCIFNQEGELEECLNLLQGIEHSDAEDDEDSKDYDD